MSSASRILATMLKHGVVAQDPTTRRYRLGSQLAVLANTRKEAADLRSVAAPHLNRLRDLTRETVAVYGRHGLERICLAQAESPQELRYAGRVGAAWPWSALGATNRAILAHLEPPEVDVVLAEITAAHGEERARAVVRELEPVQATGVARSRNERVPGSASLSAAVFDAAGCVCGAISIIGPAARLTDAVMDGWQDELRLAALATSQELGFRGPRAGAHVPRPGRRPPR
jgi:DNA-binding IclR family transcriptional regulator